MSEEAGVVSIKAHQQMSFPLLRRPRPPKPTLSNKATSSSNRTTSFNISKREEPLLDSEEKKPQSRPSTILPLPRLHPTPFTPHHHPPHPHPHTHHTSKHHAEKTLTEDEVSTDTPTTANDFVIHPLFPRGPPFFPPGNILSLDHGYSLDPWWRDGGNLSDFAPSAPATEERQFALNDFLLDHEEAKTHLVPTKLQGCMISRQNYLKLTSWFATHVPQQKTLNTVALTVDHQAREGRKPQHQILLELEALIKEALTTSSTSIEEESTKPRGKDREEHGRVEWPTPAPGDVVFQGSTSRYFCGHGRSDSPFDSSAQPLISPSEVAILESMMEGGHELDLKAHFLSSLPSLSPLSRTLSHLNLSFNDLRVFPPEVLELTQLVSLKMRNNPIRSIPDDISMLVKLEMLCISFNLISQLPTGLFELRSLSELDVSHNAIQQLPNHIGKLRNLRKLNVEGNELIGLPPSILSLPLSHLLVADNYMHPCLWRENCRSQPQALTDISCVVISRYVSPDDPHLPGPSREILQHRHDPDRRCDLCKGLIFGSELRVIRSAPPEIFRQKNLPIVFSTCSQTCRRQCRDLCLAAV